MKWSIANLLWHEMRDEENRPMGCIRRTREGYRFVDERNTEKLRVSADGPERVYRVTGSSMAATARMALEKGPAYLPQRAAYMELISGGAHTRLEQMEKRDFVLSGAEGTLGTVRGMLKSRAVVETESRDAETAALLYICVLLMLHEDDRNLV